ncbi:hypothetical protein VCSRO62_0160 [Vibrio cholerae]|uniref:hypothetical protein n=1 Tax=Vibrio TaxID=662 RepID=UPI000DE32189|nr:MULTISPECIES: hypothetical protein [Vibrio]RBM64320.1 hypothetical protein DLR71_04970 [Vibrio paracholerae]TXY16323.1 hypothetical protein FXE97_05385 [Vibrio cholerae]GHX29460.1 hypothetical protein VCSRO62_0160 [Vibrio cholerae]GHY08253.1 hypothetical protein VCSRO112_1894 [Vibrio cholerae]
MHTNINNRLHRIRPMKFTYTIAYCFFFKTQYLVILYMLLVNISHASTSITPAVVNAQIQMQYNSATKTYTVSKPNRDPFLSDLINVSNIGEFSYSHILSIEGKLYYPWPTNSQTYPGLFRLYVPDTPASIHLVHESGEHEIEAFFLPKGLDVHIPNVSKREVFRQYSEVPQATLTTTSNLKSYGGFLTERNTWISGAVYVPDSDFDVKGGKVAIAYDISIPQSETIPIRAGKYHFKGPVLVPGFLLFSYSVQPIQLELTINFPPVVNVFSPVENLIINFKPSQITASRRVPIVINANHDVLNVTLLCEAGFEKGSSGCLIPNISKTEYLLVTTMIDGKLVNNQYGAPLDILVNPDIATHNVKYSEFTISDENDSGEMPNPGYYNGRVSLFFEAKL